MRASGIRRLRSPGTWTSVRGRKGRGREGEGERHPEAAETWHMDVGKGRGGEGEGGSELGRGGSCRGCSCMGVRGRARSGGLRCPGLPEGDAATAATLPHWLPPSQIRGAAATMQVWHPCRPSRTAASQGAALLTLHLFPVASSPCHSTHSSHPLPSCPAIEQMLLALHLFPGLPDVDFIVHFGDGCTDGLPMLSWNICRCAAHTRAPVCQICVAELHTS